MTGGVYLSHQFLLIGKVVDGVGRAGQRVKFRLFMYVLLIVCIVMSAVAV